MGGVYERELRAVLAGELNGVRAIIKSCSEIERARAMQVVQRPFLVVRAPGSGSEGTGDLLVLRGDMCFPIEVKSSKSPKQYLSGRTMAQYEALRSTGERCGLLPLYAYRLKGVRGSFGILLERCRSLPVNDLTSTRMMRQLSPLTPLRR